MSRSLERRLARLEEQVPPDSEPDTLEMQFLNSRGEVTGTRVFEFPWCPPLWRSLASRSRKATGGPRN